MGKGVFVTGTDTGIGKTYVAASIAKAARGRGIDVGVMKPVSAGGREDVHILKAAADVDDPDDLVNPVALQQPLSPDIAAEVEGVTVDITSIYTAFARLTGQHDWLVVEGAGGILVPVTADVSIVDLAVRFAFPVLIVARAALGTINHTRLTIEALQHRGLSIAGVVYNAADDGEQGLSATRSPATIEAHTGVPTLGSIPHAADGRAFDSSTLNLQTIFER